MFQFFIVLSPLLFHSGKVFPFGWSQSCSCKHPIVWDPNWPNTTEGNPKEIDWPYPNYGIHDVIHDHSITFSVATFPNCSSPRWTAKLGGFLPDKATSRAEPVTWRLSRGNPSGIHQFLHVVEKQEKVMQSCQCETKLLPAMKGVAIKSTCMSRRLLLDISVIFTITFYWVKQAGLKSLAALALFWKGLDLSQTGYVAISLANFWNNWVKQPIPISCCLSCHSVRRWPQLCSEQPESAGVGSAHELGYWNCERMVVDLEQMEKYRPVSPVASEMTGHHPFFLFLAI